MERLHSEERVRGIRLLILDLDGTLADTIESIREAVNLALRKFALPERSYEEVRAAIGNGARMLMRHSVASDRILSEEEHEELFQCYHRLYGETYSHCNTCYEGVIDTLTALKQRGYTLAVLSNKQDVYVKALVEQLLPAGTVEIAMGQTERPKKPDPTVPLEIASALGFGAEETAFIGDSEVDIQTAIRAGMLPIGCGWGYRDVSLLKQEGAAVILDVPAELADLFC